MILMLKHKNRAGFTIVELLVVIVVIAILAAISVVAYTGIQQRARDAIRKSDLSNIAKALEIYFLDNGQYPPGQIGWCTQISNPVHPDVANALSQTMGQVPRDPQYRNTYRDYFYRNNGSTYNLYAQLETSSNGSWATGGCSVIGGTQHSYSYAHGQ